MNVGVSGWTVVLVITVFLFTVVGTWLYRAFALNRNIVANPNFRSLHQRPVPRGGGIVFSVVCLSATTGLWLAADIDPRLGRAIVIGGLVAAVFGFVDDIIQIRARSKLVVQVCLAAWVLNCFNWQPLCDLPFTPKAVDLAINWLGLVWLMNLCNFIDGTDGMAASGAVMISGISILALVMVQADQATILVFGFIAASSAGFLVFNWPPASIFMGDAGSLFLGYCFTALLASTVSGGQITLWTWAVFFGYFGGDTTTTTLVRICLVEEWYGEHRSHAYQNIARLTGSHLKVLRGVSLYHLFWLLPLSIWSVISPATAIWPTILAFLPVVVWTLRYGPRLSSS